jgi:CheY-like chemotaxis protein
MNPHVQTACGHWLKVPQCAVIGAVPVISAKEQGMRSSAMPTVVLVVEDEWLLRDTIACELRDAGCEVIESRTAEDAIAHAGRQVDVVFTDIQLPGQLDGWDVAERFRAADADVVIIYTSGNSADRSRRVSDSLFFNKPYDTAAVVQACEQHAATKPAR